MASVVLENCDEVVEGVFLGGREAAEDLEALRRADVRAVVCCMREQEYATDLFHPGIEYYRLDVEDMGREPIEFFWPEAIDFIHGFRAEGQRVLVHCRAGVSRSASTVLAYMMLHEGYSLYSAFVHTRARRPIVTPNPGFMEKLTEFEESHCKMRSSLSFDGYMSWFSGECSGDGLGALRLESDAEDAEALSPMTAAATERSEEGSAASPPWSPRKAGSSSPSTTGDELERSPSVCGQQRCAELPDEEPEDKGSDVEEPRRDSSPKASVEEDAAEWVLRVPTRPLYFWPPSWTTALSSMLARPQSPLGFFVAAPAVPKTTATTMPSTSHGAWRSAALRTARSGRFGAVVALAMIYQADHAPVSTRSAAFPAAAPVFRFIEQPRRPPGL